MKSMHGAWMNLRFSTIYNICFVVFLHLLLDGMVFMYVACIDSPMLLRYLSYLMFYQREVSD